MEVLLDTSWTLHFISTNSNSYQNLFSPSTTQHHLTRYFDRLPQFLASQRPQYVDDLDNSNEKLGTLRDCKYTSSKINPPQASPAPIIQIVLVYQNSTFTFTLYTPHLILSKAPATQTKHVLEFVSNTFSITTFPLRLPPSLLSHVLEDYVSTLTNSAADDSLAASDGLERERRAALLRAAVGQLKLTISFSGPVAPHLRTMDLNIPYETVDALASAAKLAAGSSGRGFMAELAEHVHLQTGLKLPLGADAIVDSRDEPSLDRIDESGIHDSDLKAMPLRLSKLTSAGFAISVDGKLKFADKAVENAVDREQLVLGAYLGILDSVVKEATDQGRGDSG